MLIRVICSDRYLPEMDVDMPQTEVNKEVFFDVTPAGSLLPGRRLIYRLVGNLKAVNEPLETQDTVSPLP